MSVQAISWAIQTTIRTALPHCPSHVLLILANYANQDGYSWPSQAHIAESCGMSKRQVIRGLKTLEDAGHITRHRRYSETTGYQVASMYHLEFGLSDIVSPSNSDRLSDKTERLSDKTVGPKCQGVTPLDTKVDTKEYTKEDARARDAAGAALFFENGDKQKSKKSTRRQQQDDHQAEAPDWLPKSAWQEWISHRKHIGKPMSQKAQALMLEKLEELHRQKHDVVALMNYSIMNNYPDIFPPRTKRDEKDNRLSLVERVERDCDKWYRDRNGGKSWDELQAECDALEVDGVRLQ